MALDIAQVAELSRHVSEEVEEAVVGKRAGLQNVMVGILSSGSHILLEDYPGLAKTLITNSFFRRLGPVVQADSVPNGSPGNERLSTRRDRPGF